MSSILKRKFEEVDSPSPCLSLRGSDDEVSASDSGNSSDSINPTPSGAPAPSSILRREKRLRARSNVHFESVTVYYFSRRQGFTSVPTQGGSTLGMSTRHSWVQHYTLGEFAVEQERSHRNMLRDHLKEEKLNSIKLKLTKNGTVESDEAEALTLADISEEDIDLDNTEVDEYFFLQPLTTRRRRALLRDSGVRRIEVEEKHELRAIRVSREECGCHCRGLCDPGTCACSLAGIKCQVDRMSFPCGCSKDGCSNTSGRVEFNPIRVRTHFLHTIMKLELEKSREQQQQQPQQMQPVANGNGYHGDLPTQRSLQSPLTDSIPHAPIMHFQTAGDADQHLEEEEDEEEEDEEDDDDDEEYEDEDDSSLCSGLSDCSTHSLDTNDSEEEDEEEEEEEENWECTEDEPSLPPVSHTEVVPLSSVLGFANSTNHTNPNSFYHNSPAEFYQMDNSNATPTLPCEPLSEAPSLTDRQETTKWPATQGQLQTPSEPHTDHRGQTESHYTPHHFTHTNAAPAVIACSSATQEHNTAPSDETGELHLQTNLHKHLNNSPQSELSVWTGEQQREGSFNGPTGAPCLPDIQRKPPSLHSTAEVTRA